MASPRRLNLFIPGLLVLVLPVALMAVDVVPIGDFNKTSLDGWEPHTFVGETTYQLYSVADKMVLRASSQKSASALIYKIKVDLRETPILNWSWRKLKAMNPGDETLKQGDDFSARVYVIREGGVFFWNTRALNYVWSADHRKGEVWDNPFAGHRAKMISMRDADDSIETWYREHRIIAQDMRDILGEEPGFIHAVAIMTDTDNSGLEAMAEYGNIFFSSAEMSAESQIDQ